MKWMLYRGFLALLLCFLPLTARAEGLQEQVTLVYHGELMRTRAREETVAQLLERLALEVKPEDVLSHGLEDAAQGGMTIRLDQVITRQESYTTTVPHETTGCNDPNMPEGTWEDLNTGTVYEVGPEGETITDYVADIATLPTFYNTNAESEIAPTLVDGIREIYAYAKSLVSNS